MHQKMRRGEVQIVGLGRRPGDVLRFLYVFIVARDLKHTPESELLSIGYGFSLTFTTIRKSR